MFLIWLNEISLLTEKKGGRHIYLWSKCLFHYHMTFLSQFSNYLLRPHFICKMKWTLFSVYCLISCIIYTFIVTYYIVFVYVKGLMIRHFDYICTHSNNYELLFRKWSHKQRTCFYVDLLYFDPPKKVTHFPNLNLNFVRIFYILTICTTIPRLTRFSQ